MNQNVLKIHRMGNLCAIISSVLLVCGVSAAEPDGIDGWVQGHLIEGEEVLCQAVRNYDEYYFVSRSEDKLKVGYRINITGTDGVSKSFIVRWGFKNSEGMYIGLSGEPKIDAAEFIELGKSKYYEEVAYYDVFLDDSKIVDVAVGIKKYSLASKVPSMSEFEDSDLNEIIICEGVLMRRKTKVHPPISPPQSMKRESIEKGDATIFEEKGDATIF